jgi:hypothetical protein
VGKAHRQQEAEQEARQEEEAQQEVRQEETGGAGAPLRRVEL